MAKFLHHRQRLLLILGLLLLIVSRLIWVHDDPTDFPADRNFTTLQSTLAIAQRWPVAESGVETGLKYIPLRELTPELPVQPWIAAKIYRLGGDPVIAARIIALFASFMTGWGIFCLTRLSFPARPWLASGSLILFAVCPLSIFMGRALLPDSLMMAALVWALVMAAGPSHSGRSLSLAMIFLSLAALLKLPAFWFAPVVGFAWIAPDWRNRRAWIYLFAGWAAVWLVICAWYRLMPWNPFPGLHRLSASTNNIIAGWRDLIMPGAYQVLLDRVVLAWTLPGAMLILIGIGSTVSLDASPANRSFPNWVWVWLAMSIAFVFVTLRANTYWAYILCPPGAVLGIAGLAGLCRLPRLWNWLSILSILFLIIICPGTEEVRSYFRLPWKYPPIREAGKGMQTPGLPLYDNESPFIPAWFTGRRGIDPTDFGHPALLKGLAEGRYPYLLSTAMTGSSLVKSAFLFKPIISYKQDSYVLFDSRREARVGQLLAGAPAGVAHNLFNILLIHSISVERARAVPGEQVRLKFVVSRGSDFTTHSLPQFTVGFIHQASGELVCLAPQAGGGLLFNSEYPLIQLPDLSRAPAVEVSAVYQIPTEMPAGHYGLTLGLRNQWGVPIGERQKTTSILEVAAPPVQQLPITIRFRDAIRFMPDNRIVVNWFGRQGAYALVGDQSNLIFSLPLKPGRYHMEVRAKAQPAGEPNDRWPILVVRQPHTWHELKLNRPWTHTYEIDFEWRGPEDFFQCYIRNFFRAPYDSPPAFPLYLDQSRGLNRAALLDTVVITAH